jgi:hypothetical protein
MALMIMIDELLEGLVTFRVSNRRTHRRMSQKRVAMEYKKRANTPTVA